MPDPISVMLLVRRAVDLRAQGIHLGAALLRDAVRRAVSVAQNVGLRPRSDPDIWSKLTLRIELGEAAHGAFEVRFDHL